MTFLTTQQVAGELGVRPRRVLQLVRSGRLPATKYGRDWLIRPEDLESVRVRKPGNPLTGPDRTKPRTKNMLSIAEEVQS